MLEKSGYRLIVLLVCLLVCGTFAAEKPTSLGKACSSEGCHDGFLDAEYGHGPVLLNDCHSCHKPLDVKKHTFEFVRKGRDLCEFCHMDQSTGKNVHAPVKDGDCLQCHDPHGSNHPGLLVKETAEVCGQCHKIAEGAAFRHGPVAVGECSICHDPHSSDHEKLLTTKPSELCFSCHVTTKQELEKFEFIHEPVKGDCVGCHDAHGADNAMMLKAKAPQLCYPCHEEIQNTAENSKVKHSIVSKEDGCLQCHTPHASSVKFGLRDAPATICLTCHDKPVDISKDEVLPAFTKELEGKKFLHGPVADKDCSGCHVTHGSDHFRLLAKKYPSQFYAPFAEENYALCFGCHAKSLVLTAKTKDLTDFRNGNLNLHFLHVNKERRGRTCRSCHATHASNLPRHIRKSVPYGAWELPVGFTKTETGGNCKTGCHLPKAYDRNKPVDYSIMPPAGKTIKAKKNNETAESQDK